MHFSSFFSFFITLFFWLFHSTYSSSIPFNYCSKSKNTRYQVDEIEIIESDSGYEILIYGTPDNDIQCGHIKIYVWSYRQQIYRNKVDLCEFTQCPLAAKEPSLLTGAINQTFPSGVYEIQLRMDTDCNSCDLHCGLGCVEFTYTVA